MLSAQSPSSQAETSISIPQSFSIFFYTQPLAEGQISGSTWTVTIYAQAVPGQTDTGSLTAELSIYSLDGTIQNALIGSSSGNAVTATTTKIDIPIQGVTATVKNGDRLTLRLYAESVAGSTASLKIFYDGQGNELLGDESRIQTTATVEESWRQDFEANPFSLSSVNRYWQAFGTGSVTQVSIQYYTASHSLRVTDKSGSGTYARYDFNTVNNPSEGLPSGTILSFYWLATSVDSMGTSVLSLHLQISDQGSSYEHYWYWSSSNTTIPPLVYPGTKKAAGMYMGPISLGSWTKHELLNWKKQAEITLGVSLQSPRVVSVSLQSTGLGKATDVYWDNIFVSSYTPSAQPQRMQEGQTNTLSLTVTGAIPSTTYQFEFNVTDPAGITTTSMVSHTTSSSETNFIVSRIYPDDFQGSGVLVGNYNVSIRQTGPVYLIPQGSGFITDYVTTSTSFTVHLADRAIYQRTDTLRFQASGYGALERANVTLLGPDPSSNYLVPVQADSTGMIVTTWVIPRNAALGNYTLTVKAITTIKIPSDSDQFNVTSAVLQLSRLSTDATDYQRTQNVTLHATLLYPGQSIVPDGYLEFQVVQPDGSVFLTSTALPDGSGGYVASFKIPTAAPIGSWQIIVPSWQSGDPSGNNGPTKTSAVRFAVSPAVLQVQTSVSIDNSQNGRTLQIQASITYPDGSHASAGQAMAQLVHNGITIVYVPLMFDAAKAMWIGYYQIKSSDPEGLWLVVISAKDLAGPVSNSIYNVVHNVLVDGAASYWNIDMSLVMAILAPVGALIAFIAWRLVPRRKRLSVALETEKVMQTVNKVQSTDFFRSIRDQLATASSLRNEK